jgi:hypothetical protein
MERCERKLVWPRGMSYLRMFLKLLWRTREIIKIRAPGGILIRNFVNINIPVLWDMMLCRHQWCLLFQGMQQVPLKH